MFIEQAWKIVWQFVGFSVIIYYICTEIYILTQLILANFYLWLCYN